MCHRSQRRRRGSNALEFALVLPVLVVMLGGIFEWGWCFMSEMLLLHVVKEGARVGAATPIDQDPADAVDERVREAIASTVLGQMDSSALQVITTLDDTGDYRVLTVRVDLPYVTLTKLAPAPEVRSAQLSTRMEEVEQASPDAARPGRAREGRPGRWRRGLQIPLTSLSSSLRALISSSV